MLVFKAKLIFVKYMATQIKPERIDRAFIFSRLDEICTPILNGQISIPNIIIPKKLAKKPIIESNVDEIILNVRMILNNVTSVNVSTFIGNLRSIILSGVTKQDELKNITEEIYLCLLISEENVKNGMILVNSIAKMCVIVDPDSEKLSSNIGTFFLEKCREDIMNSINVDNMKILCNLNNVDDTTDLDEYNKKKTHIINLINVLCILYKQRHDSDNIRLGSAPIYSVINKIISAYKMILSKIEELGDPYSKDGCLDEELHEQLSKISTLYAEFIFTFMKKIGSELNKCTDICDNKLMSELVTVFKEEIIPTITESYLIARCKNIEY